LDLFYPSIAANTNGVVVIACNGSSTNTYISSFAYVAQTAHGVTTFGNHILLAAGSVVYHDLNEQFGATESRWGDYSTLSVDPADPNRFWTIQMIPIYDSFFDSGDLWQMQITEIITSLVGPPLVITMTGTNLIVSWPASDSGYQLQYTTNLTATAGWLPVTQASSTNGNTISVALPNVGPQKFFRLKHAP
jgi:hypothetical protein